MRHHHFAGLELAHGRGADQVEGASFGSEAGAAACAVDTGRIAEQQRPEAPRVARGDHPLAADQQQRVGAAHLLEREHQRLDDALPRLARHQVEDHLGVGGRLEDGAVALEPVARLDGVDQVAVVHDAERPHRGIDDDRLRVGEHRGARRRVAGVADGGGAGEPLEHRLLEDLRRLAHAALDVHAGAVPGDDAGALLPAVLERVEAEVSEVRRVLAGVDAEDAAHGVLAGRNVLGRRQCLTPRRS